MHPLANVNTTYQPTYYKLTHSQFVSTTKYLCSRFYTLVLIDGNSGIKEEINWRKNQKVDQNLEKKKFFEKFWKRFNYKIIF